MKKLNATTDLSFKNSSKIYGRALIIWDPECTNKKRDAIDTDQITPAEYCVSENLERLDENWKIGTFYHLMPDFRQRVHQGENFLVVGARFGIGSSREMSPAGLKAIAEEIGLELVIICGDGMGNIFRRNALNLGLHIVHSSMAVADAQEGDEFEFDKISRRLKNITQNKSYAASILTDKEEQICKIGGIFNLGRREFLKNLSIQPHIEWPEPNVAHTMSIAEQIVWAHRVDKNTEVKPGSTLPIYADLFPASDGTAPFAIYTFNKITANRIHPRSAAIINDHFVFTDRSTDQAQITISQTFAKYHNIQKPYYSDPGDGIFHFYLPEKGLIQPGGFYAGADSHSSAYGAYGALGIGVGSTTLGFGWALGYIYLTLAKQRRVSLQGKLQPWVTGKDIVLNLLKHWGASQAQGMGVEFIDVHCQLPMNYRNTIANMMAEAEAQSGIFVPDAITSEWFKSQNIPLKYPLSRPGEEAHYELEEEFNLSNIRPVIAKPYSPNNVWDADEVAKERITFVKALIGSCTNGSYDDLLQAAILFKLALHAGITSIAKGVELAIYPGSKLVKVQITQPDPRLGGQSIAEIIQRVGGKIRESWCGPCFGQGADRLNSGEKAITTFNRNWHNRMGVKGEGYLASPIIVASSALLGYMGTPTELGLTWQPHIIG